MDSFNPIVKSVSPPSGLRGQENFHYQHLRRQANTSLSSGETYIAAYIPGKNHQQIFERAWVSFENHYYKSEIEDSQIEKFSRSIRAINAGMEEIRQYYKSQRQAFEYSFCILTVSGSEFLLSACGKTYIIAEDSASRLHEVCKPDEFLDFTGVISGSTNQLKNIYLAVCNELYQPLIDDNGKLAYSILLASEKRTEVPWQAITLRVKSNIMPKGNSAKSDSKSPAKYFSTVKTTLTKGITTLKSRLRSRQVATHKTANSTDSKQAKPASKTKSIQNFWTTLWSKYINPSPIRALIIVGLIIAVVIITIIGLNIYQGNQKISQQYQQINSLYNSAQSSKSAQDSKTAENQLNQLVSTISSLTPSQKSNLVKYANNNKKPSLDEMLTSANSLLDELHNIYRVGANKVYSEPNFSYSLTNISGNLAYMLNPNNGKLLSYDLTNQKTLTKSNSTLSNTNILTSSYDSPQVFASTPSQIFQIKTDLSAIEQKTASPTWPVAQAMSTYGGNLYFLATAQNQIYRFRSVGNGSFGPQTNYLKTPDPNISNAVSMVIANSIYTTTKSGQISMYTQGSPQTFTTSNLPTLQNVSQIGYRSAPETLVLFDSNKQSFVFLSVKGNTASFTKEIIVNNTTNITSFSIDDKKAMLYFVSSDGLFSLPL
jgi:hypothetical protein